MTALELSVVTASAATIAWINWYFFLAANATTRAAQGASGVQEVLVEVDGGYSPSSISVEAGRPVRLSFARRDMSGYSEEVVLPDFGIRKFLPTGEQTTVEFTPAEPGTYQFTCGMGMLRGRLVVARGTRS